MARLIHSFGLRSLCVVFLSLLLELIPVVASPTPAVKTTLVSADPVLTKRVKQPVPYFANDYDGRIDKGDWLNRLFSLNDTYAKEWASPFQDPADIFTWGWTPYIFWWPYVNDQGTRKPEFGDKLDEAFTDPVFLVDQSNNGLYHFVHDKQFVYQNGRKGQPTYARYTNVANPRAGAFIFDSNWSPKHSKAQNKKGDIPDLDTMSDLAYFQWRDSCQAIGAAFGSLKVIFHAHIIYAPTFNIVIEAMREAKHPRVPGWDQRVTFSMDSWEGLAILGSTHGAATSWFLIQHREELGAKRIKEVVVWGAGGGFELNTNVNLANLNLRFTITDA